MSVLSLVVNHREEPNKTLTLVDRPALDHGSSKLDWEGPGVALRWRWDESYEARPQEIPVAGGIGWIGGLVFNTTAEIEEAIAGVLTADHRALGNIRGQWNLVVWNERTNGLVAVSDHLALRPLVYAPIPGGGVVASGERQVVAHPGVSADVDEATLAVQLVGRVQPVGPTLFAAVTTVGPSRLVRIDAGKAPTLHRWFAPPTDLLPIRSLGDAADHIGEALRTVVPRWLPDSRFGLGLSGGLDSTMLATLVAGCGRGEDMVALTLRYPGLDADETEYQDAVVEAFGLDEIQQGQSVDFDYVGELERRSAAGHLPIPWLEVELVELLRKARSAGIVSALHGAGGDELFVHARPTAADVIASPSSWGRFGARDTHGYVDWSLRSTLKGLAPRRLTMHRRSGRWSHVVSDDAAVRTSLVERTTPPARRPGFQGQADALRWERYDSSAMQRTTGNRVAHDSWARVRKRTPFLDVDVVESCLQTPGLWFAHHRDWRRLQRRTGGPRLPSEVKNRRGKVHFGSVVAPHVLGPATASVFDDLLLERIGLVDGTEVRARFAHLEAAHRNDPTSTAGGLPAISQVLAYEIWLRNVTT